MRMTLEGLQQNAVYYVQLRTKYRGATSDWSRRFDLVTLKDTIKPGPVTDLNGVFNEGNLTLSWARPAANEDGSPLEDLKDYVVTIDPAPEDPEWPSFVIYAEGTKAIFTKEANAAAFGRYRAGLSITVQARDIVDNLSEPVTIIKAKPKPRPVTNLVWEAKDNAFVGSWIAPSESVDGTPFTDSDGYELKVIYVGTNGFQNVVTKIIPSTSFTFSYEDNKAAFGGPDDPPRARGRLTLEVRARDSVLQVSEPAVAIAENFPPKKVAGVVAKPMVNAVRIEWAANAQEDSVAYYEVFVADNSTAAGTFAGRTTTNFYIHDTFNYGQDHYYYVYAVDDFTLASERSDQITPARPVNPFSVDTEPPAVPNGLQAFDHAGGEEPSAIRVTWTAVPEAKGYHVAYSLNVNPPVWEYVDVPENVAQAVLAPLVSQRDYRIRVRSYDGVINPSGWQEITRTSPYSNVEVTMGDISSDIRVISGGVLRSENYDEAAGTGWRLMPSGLDIQSGSLNARVLRAGELRSSILAGADSAEPGQPLWALNLEGNLTVRSARVKGQLIVGESGIANDRVQVASYNAGAPTGSYWALRGDGSFVTRTQGSEGASSRLEISGNGIRGYDSAGVERVGLGPNGRFMFQTTNGGITFDDNGLRVFNGNTPTVSINRDGNASFSGELKSRTGVIGGWGISEFGLGAGLVSLRSDLGELRAGNGTNTVGMRMNYGFWAGANDFFSSPPFSVSSAGALTAFSGNIGGFTINSGFGLYSGVNGNTVGMMPGLGFWVGANNFDSAATQIRSDGTLYSRSANINGDVQARTFRSSQSAYGLSSNYIEIGNTGPRDPVDEIRFFLNTTRASLRNPSDAQGALRVSASAGGVSYIYDFHGNGNGFMTNGARINTSGGQLDVGFINSYGITANGTAHASRTSNDNGTFSPIYWNPSGTVWIRPNATTSMALGAGGDTRYIGASNVGNFGTKTFVIDHPTKPDNYLVHAAIEGPTADVYYRGVGRLQLDGGGTTTTGAARLDRVEIVLPEYFEALTELEGRTVMVTPLVGECSICHEFVTGSMGASKVENGRFKVYQLAGYYHPCAQFYWEVKAVRKKTAFEVEPSKTNYTLNGDGPYTYLTANPTA